MNTLTSILLACGLAAATLSTTLDDTKTKTMELGNFSVSLAVKDIKASRAFYEKLGFKEVAGDMKQNWIVLQNGTTTVGLFQGMFERNMLTFNPGWTSTKETLKDFQDVRELQHALKERGVRLQSEADETTDGPASFMLVDPDGNPILVDQHVPRPKRQK
jgi:catechol 2,3-dioxygenase-like lactoylglutathione lyase family enzyme